MLNSFDKECKGLFQSQINTFDFFLKEHTWNMHAGRFMTCVGINLEPVVPDMVIFMVCIECPFRDKNVS